MGAGEDVGKAERSHPQVGAENGAASLESSLAIP